MRPPPWKIKVVEPIALRPERERRRALERAGYNTFLLRSEDVFVDLLTDSGTSALSQEQRAAMELGDEAYAGSRSFFRLEEAVRDAYGYRHVIPTHQGRGAEHLLAKVLISPGQLVPSNLYLTTSREHVELAGGVWIDVSIAEARDPESKHPFKGNLDLTALERVLAAAAPERVAFVRIEACLNMAGGQPFSLANLVGVRELTRAHGVRLILDATRISENALFVKDREPGFADWTLPELIGEIAEQADGAVFSSKKDHFVPIGGLLALRDDDVAERARELVVVYEGFPHYGGLSGHDMEALAQGIHESADESLVRHYVSQSAHLGELLRERRIPIVVPVGAHAVFLDAKRFLPHIPQEEFPAQALAAALYLAGGVRSMERGIVSGQHGDEPYDGLELVRLTIPRRVYTAEHLMYVADVVADVYERREEVPGLKMTYEPAHLRFFQARFEPRAPVLEPTCHETRRARSTTPKERGEEAMTVTADLRHELDRARLDYGVIAHRRTETAREEARVIGVPPEEVAKTVVLATGDGYVRAVVPASGHVDLYKTRAVLGSNGQLRLAREAELAFAYPTYELGAVPPFGPPAGDRVLVDRRLARRQSVVLEAGSHTESLRLKTADLLMLTDAEVADIAAD